MTDFLRVIVIGGGAAGFFGAINCATTYPHCQVTLLEAATKPLGKVRISGGGRCNVTHHCFDPTQLIQYYPRGGKALRSAFTRFQPQDTVTWFNQHGVKLKTEADGRMFPITDNSETIVNCLLDSAINANVKILTSTPVKSVSKSLDNTFIVDLKSGESLKCDRLLIATGSNPLGYSWAQDLGHHLESPVPSLFTFKIQDPRIEDLAGISFENVSVKLVDKNQKKLEQTGALLITHWGLSGPAILKLSAWGARILYNNKYQMELLINWVYPHNAETFRQHLLEIKSQQPKKQLANYAPCNLPRRFWQRLLSVLEINSQKIWSELGKKEINKLVQELTQGVYQIQGKGVFKEEFVTCGGVSLSEINFKTMESQKCQGLYFSGEILDIDGVTGGFNFQNAWTTSWIASQAIGNKATL